MKSVARAITDQWWLIVLQGILAIVFGVVAWVWPDLTITTLVILFGAFAIASGILSFAGAMGAHRMGVSPWPMIFRGVLGIGTGVVVAVWPDISATALIYVIAAYAVVIGIYELLAAIELRKVINNEWFLGLAGIASIVFGVLTFISPGDGAVALVWAIGVYAVVFGGLLIALGFRLHGWGRHLTSTSTSATA
jgi:uncharacterized membrane protein HdeD (DUF308 family)